MIYHDHHRLRITHITRGVGIGYKSHVQVANVGNLFKLYDVESVILILYLNDSSRYKK